MRLLPKGSHRQASAHILCAVQVGPCPALRRQLHAGMAELVDAPDSKSGFRKEVGVRFPLPAPSALRRATRSLQVPDDYYEVLLKLWFDSQPQDPV